MQQESMGDQDRSAEEKDAEDGPERRLELTEYVSAKDVQQALGCSMSLAYEHLRRATGKKGRGLLRAPVEVWEAYARRAFGAHATVTGTSDTINNDHVDWLHDLEAQLDHAHVVLSGLRGIVAQRRRQLRAP